MSPRLLFVLLVFLSIIVITPIGFAQPAASWVEVGSGSATFPGGVSNGVGATPSIAFAPDGTLYATWSVFTGTQTEVYVRRFDGTTWVEVGAGSASGGGISNDARFSVRPRIAVAPDGMPYVVWEGLVNGTGDSEIYIRRFDGVSWVEVGSGSATGGGISNTTELSQFPSFGITSNGSIYVAWSDNSTGGGLSEIYIRQFTGATWDEVGVGSASATGISNTGGASLEPSLAIGPGNLPYVAWQDNTGPVSGEIFVRRFDGANWVEVSAGSAMFPGGVSNTIGASTNPSLAFDNTGASIVAWTEQSGGTPGGIYVRRFDGTSWIEIGTGSASGDGISDYSPFANQLDRPTLAITRQGVPYVAWFYNVPSGEVVIHVRRFNGILWEEIPTGSATGLGVLGAPPPAANSWPWLAIHPITELPYIAWDSGSAGVPEGGILVRRLEILPPTPTPMQVAQPAVVAAQPTPTATLADVQELPQTGETPLWRDLLLVALASFGVTLGLFVLRWTHRNSTRNDS